MNEEKTSQPWIDHFRCAKIRLQGCHSPVLLDNVKTTNIYYTKTVLDKAGKTSKYPYMVFYLN